MSRDGATRPFDDVRQALNDISPKDRDGAVRLDLQRSQRAGIPEVVLAGQKRPEALIESLRRLAEANGRALASRCSTEAAERVRAELGGEFSVMWDEPSCSIIVARPNIAPPSGQGVIGIITAGSSDAPVAAEAAVMAREMGVEVLEAHDVGVAGLHRLVQPLERMMEQGADAIIVAAGMDGALASVVAGLVPAPVIGLPTSVGYGYGGEGTGALMTMLQSCAPGLVVVNIDNGIGAGATAALIANRMASARAAGDTVRMAAADNTGASRL
jgi:NCAIR mutase (PurE)-related protein